MDGLQFVGELVGVHMPSTEAAVEANIAGKGAPSWNVTVEARKPNGKMMQLQAFFQAADRAGQRTPLLTSLLEAFGEPVALDDWRPSGIRVALQVETGVTRFGKQWFSVSRCEIVGRMNETPQPVEAPATNGKPTKVA